jgi:hypothetical protein
LFLQLGLAHIIRLILKPVFAGTNLNWAIGPVEIAGVARSIKSVLPLSEIISVSEHPFYQLSKTDFLRSFTSKGPSKQLYLLFAGAYFLAKISAQFRGVVYVGNLGYLISRCDQRAREFAFLKRHGLKIVCVLTGSDIRSVTSMLQDAKESGRENIASYLALVSPSLATEYHETVIHERCRVINRHADIIFTSPFDQKSFLRSDAKTLTPFLPSKLFNSSAQKFENLSKLIIVHAPSSPFIKGTPLVRSAVSRLRQEGFKFEYIELQNVANSEVIGHLRRAHVVLNEFYAFVPGMFGAEALASKCVLLTRASHDLDPSIPGNPNEAWIPTEPYQVYDHLLWALQNPERLAPIASAGFEWALAYAHEDSGGIEFAKELEELISV